MNEKLYYLAFSQLFEFIGPARFHRLLEIYGTAGHAWDNLQLRELISAEGLGISAGMAAKIVARREELDIEGLESLLVKNNIQVLAEFEEEFPANLKGLADSPYLLYIRGKLLPTDNKALAMVGTRKITSYGMRVIENLVPPLVNAGLTIVSGLALGVDAVVAEETLKAGGRAIAVLASGVDQITPRSNLQIGEKIIERGGAIVSEFPIGTKPQNYFFPFRNRIIAGLAKATVVVEAAHASGSLITAKYSQDYGRKVLVVPGSIYSEGSAGVHQLIREGARLVTTAAEILEEIGYKGKTAIGEIGDIGVIEKLTEEERRVYNLLSREATHIDELTRHLGISSAEVSSTLIMLELKGLARSFGGGVWGI